MNSKAKSILVGAAVLGSFTASARGFSSLGGGCEVRTNLSKTLESACGAKKDADAKKDTDAKCGDKKAEKVETKTKDGKCGEGKCGGKKAKKAAAAK